MCYINHLKLNILLWSRCTNSLTNTDMSTFNNMVVIEIAFYDLLKNTVIVWRNETRYIIS